MGSQRLARVGRLAGAGTVARVVLATAGIIGVAAASALGSAVPAQAADYSTTDYVALGDSYSSGVGAPNATGTCARSPQGYPQLWATAHKPATFTDATCGGATTDTVLSSQLSSLKTTTDLVTLTIGGNDVGFGSTMLSCQFSSDAACRSAVAEGTTEAQQVLPAKLANTYAQIRARAPQARVIVLGYPRLYSSGSCAFGLSATKRTLLNDAADLLSTGLADAVAAAGFTFVDVRPQFAGHGICDRSAYINDFSLFNLVSSYHPNANGYRLGYLPALNTVTG